MTEMNDVGEPCAGELHARFDRGPLARRSPMARWNKHPLGNPLVESMSAGNEPASNHRERQRLRSMCDR